MGTSVYRRAKDLLEAEIGDELVALDAEAGSCFGFNSVATTVWRSLEQPRSLEELQAQLLDEYDVDAKQCAADLEELIDGLVAKGLVVQSASSGNTETA